MKMAIRMFVLIAFGLSWFGLASATHAQVAPESAFQVFERGYMLWRSDTGAVWVFMQDGWQVRYFPQSSYENLPDNPVVETPPDGLISPVRGFGRVWGNFPDVRAALGWALGPEIGYTARFAPTAPTAGGLQQTAVDLPGSQVMLVREDHSWQIDNGQPRSIWSLNQPITIPITIQTFEYGHMMWWSETGTIWILNANNRRVQYFDSLSYGALPDNPVTGAPPAGRIKPIMGFGKVWGHFPAVRDDLGWAVAASRSYLVSFERIPGSGVFACEINHPDLGTIAISGDAWRMIPSGGGSAGGITTYGSLALGFAFDYPADWTIQVDRDAGHGVSELVTVTSYDPALVKLSFEAYSYAGGWTLDSWVSQYRRRVDGVTLEIVDEQVITLLDGISALRLDMVSGTGGFPVLLTVIDGNGIIVEGTVANTTIFDSVVSTLRAS